MAAETRWEHSIDWWKILLLYVSRYKKKRKKENFNNVLRDIKYQVYSFCYFFYNLYLLCFYSNIKVVVDDLHMFLFEKMFFILSF